MFTLKAIASSIMLNHIHYPRRVLVALGAALLTLVCSCSGGDGDGGLGPGASAASSISGFALTAEGHPMPGVRVSTLDGEVSTQSDVYGRFELMGLKVPENGVVALLFDAALASPESSFRLRMDYALSENEQLELPSPMYIPVPAVGDGTFIHGHTDQTVYSAEHPGASIQVPAGGVDFSGVHGVAMAGENFRIRRSRRLSLRSC